MKPPTKTKGLTLVELMIVIAIIGILSSVAMPAYQDYLLKTKTAEVITLLGAAKLVVDENYQITLLEFFERILLFLALKQ